MSYHRLVRLPMTLLLLATILRSAAAEDLLPPPPIDHQDWKVLGWNDSCGVALTVLSYPKLGEAMVADPLETRAGTMIIPVGKENAETRWILEADGPLTWNPKMFASSEKELRDAGFTRRGYPEVLRDGPIGKQPGLAETLTSTATLSSRLTAGWPPRPAWRWAAANYNFLGTCALLAFENTDAKRRYRFLLVRVYNPRARLDRAYAHVSNARLLFNDGDLEGGAAEAANAALQAPEMALARYEHAAMLSLTGNTNEAVEELGVALKIDPKLRVKLHDDIDFADLHDRDDFRALTR